jgi:hypothetical protein
VPAATAAAVAATADTHTDEVPTKLAPCLQFTPRLLLFPHIPAAAAALALVHVVLQISAFGDDTRSDGGDVWLIEWDGKAKHWKQDAKVGVVGDFRPCALLTEMLP